MKKTYLVLSALAAAMMLASCGEEPHQHVDANHDGICDGCGASGMVFEHKDDNHDHKCDQCGQTISEHVDANHDDKCDICGADMKKEEEGSGEGQGEGGEEDIHIDPIDVPTVFEECLKYDYSNMKVELEVCTGYQQGYEGYEAQGYYAEEYYLGGGKYVVFDYSTYESYIDSGYPMNYFMYKYADFNGKNYKWTEGSWADSDHQGHSYAGYILEYKDHMNVGMDHTWFYMNNLINNLTASDVDYSLGTYVIKETSIDKINNTALYFTVWDNIECSVSGMDVGVDGDGHYYFKNFKSYVDPENDRSPYVVMTFSEFGSTTEPFGCEEVPTPTASNTFDTYWEMSGEPEPVEIYIDEVEMKVDANIKYFVENEDFAALAGKSYEDAFTAGEYKESKASLDASKLYVYKDGLFYETGKAYEKDAAYSAFDLVLYEGETIDVSLFIGPDNWNKEGLTEWHFTGEEKVEQYKEEWGIYPADGFNVAFDYNSTPRLQEPTEEAKHVQRHRWLTAVHAGECEIWASHWAPYHDEVVSKKLKVMVLEPKGETIDQETASYSFTFTSCEKMYNDPNHPDDYWRTEFKAANNGNSKFNNPEYEITGMRAKLIEARYTEAFEDKGNEQLLYFGVGDQDNYQSYSYNEVVFDLKDQEVSSMSCKFSLHVSGHLSYLDNLDTADIYTSADGVTWDRYNLKNKLVNHWSQLSSSGYMDAFLYEREFTNNARYVKFQFKSKSIGRMLGIVVADLKFYSDNTCHNHEVKPAVDVTGLTIDCENSITMAQGTTLVVTPTIAPADATNKKVIFTSENPKVVKVNQNGELLAVGKGTTKVTVYSDFMNGDGEHFEQVINVTVGDKPSVDPLAAGTYSNATPVAVTIDAAKSTLTVGYWMYNSSLITGKVFNLYDIKGSDFIFVSDDGAMKLDVTFASGFGSLTIKSVTVAGAEDIVNIELTK